MSQANEEKVVSLNQDQEPVSAKEKLRSKGIYLLPNLFTTGALFSGFYAVVASMNGHFDKAAIAIFYCHDSRWLGWPCCAPNEYTKRVWSRIRFPC